MSSHEETAPPGAPIGRRPAAAVWLLLLSLSWSSTWYIAKRVILPNIQPRTKLMDDVLTGQAEAPYQYRILVPVVGSTLERTLSPLVGSRATRHAVVHVSLTFAVLMCTFAVFRAYLRRCFPEPVALLGVLLLEAAIPASVTGYLSEGDFWTLLAYVIGLECIARGWDAALPVIVGLGALNREQIVFVLVLYIAYVVASGRHWAKRTLVVSTAGLAAYLAAYGGVRAYYGPRPTPYTMAFNLSHNLAPFTLGTVVLPLWLGEVVGLAILASLAYRESDRFFRLSLLALVPYTALYLCFGILWEMAKFLPALLVLIPMALAAITGLPCRLAAPPAADRPSAHSSGHPPPGPES